MRTITLEEHFASPAFMEGPGRPIREQARLVGGLMQQLPEQLCDLGDKRIAAMDAAGISMQVLSLTAPGVEVVEPDAAEFLAREANDYLADAVRRYPQRLAGFAALAVVKPETAVKELERMVQNNGFLGAVINGHTRGRYLDDRSFWPVLECAEALRVPIYLHPTRPPQQVADVYYGGFSPLVTSLLGMAGWGWHIETAVHIIRMIVGGVFDRYPGLQVIIGHMGETLPSMIQRMDHTMTPERTKLKRPIGAYLRENVHYTFSGFNYTPVFLNLLLEVGVDRIMFSADYPYASMREASDFLDRLPVSEADREKIAHGNAERLMRIPINEPR
jgi:predicted TIM-barrel fold metal-dependent hydrolase